MKITDIRFGMLRVPLKTPFKTALRTVDKVEDIVVMVHTDDGRVGYGEAPATAVITGDTHGSIVDAIRHYIAPRLIGQDIADLNRVTKLIQDTMEKNTSAKAAVEIAVYDLWGQLYGAPLYKLLGGGDPVISTDITISVDYIDKMVADSVAAVERGFESLKIKVGKDIGVDIERVRAIYAAVEDRALAVQVDVRPLAFPLRNGHLEGHLQLIEPIWINDARKDDVAVSVEGVPVAPGERPVRDAALPERVFDPVHRFYCRHGCTPLSWDGHSCPSPHADGQECPSYELVVA